MVQLTRNLEDLISDSSWSYTEYFQTVDTLLNKSFSLKSASDRYLLIIVLITQT